MGAATPVRVLIADDHSVVVEGIRRVLEGGGHEIVGSAENGRQAIEMTRAFDPDVIILDVTMPILNGIEAARQIRADNPAARILFMSMHTDPLYVREAFRVGAAGYVIKRTAASELCAAIQRVMSGGHYISPAASTSSLRELLETNATPRAFGGDLTKRQREVLQLVAEGKTAKEIASVLNISIKTVEFHKTSIMDALGIRTIAELTRYAVDHGIVG
jgi:DNA-binding NarL/FixJ family response regulator